jgi:hypothetical protein
MIGNSVELIVESFFGEFQAREKNLLVLCQLANQLSDLRWE